MQTTLARTVTITEYHFGSAMKRVTRGLRAAGCPGAIPTQAQQGGECGCRHDAERKSDQDRLQRSPACRRRPSTTATLIWPEARTRAPINMAPMRRMIESVRIPIAPIIVAITIRTKKEMERVELSRTRRSTSPTPPHRPGSLPGQLGISGARESGDIDVLCRNRPPVLQAQGAQLTEHPVRPPWRHHKRRDRRRAWWRPLLAARDWSPPAPPRGSPSPAATGRAERSAGGGASPHHMGLVRAVSPPVAMTRLASPTKVAIAGKNPRPR